MELLPLFAVLDPARDPRIYPAIQAYAPDAQCLFRGPLDPQLVQVSPHVMPVVPGNPLAKWWRSEGRGQAWGILVEADAELDDVRHHLRTLTRVTLPGRQTALFRFWDPRVLRAWLPHCDGPQLVRAFGFLARWHAEAEDGASTLTYALDGDRLVVE